MAPFRTAWFVEQVVAVCADPDDQAVLVLQPAVVAVILIFFVETGRQVASEEGHAHL